jgi:hypothetical protein
MDVITFPAIKLNSVPVMRCVAAVAPAKLHASMLIKMTGGCRTTPGNAFVYRISSSTRLESASAARFRYELLAVAKSNFVRYYC